MKLTEVPSLAQGCRLSLSEGQPASILIPEGMLKLSASGQKIVELCDGVRSIEEIIASLQEGYDPSAHAQIAKDTIRFLERLHERRAVNLK